MSEKVMARSEATRTNAETAVGSDGRLARLETDMEWVKRLLWFLIALVIGIYLDLPAVVQGLLPQ
ncbi:MAG: hypothetical protein OXG84_12110 [Chloroflexi bacterium]|nr:hypothetical protein [Chloroflexota bacterium]